LINSSHVRDFPFKVWVGGSSIFIEETKHPPRFHSHPCFLFFAVCAGSQPAIRDSSNLIVTFPKALFKKGVAALVSFFCPNIHSCDACFAFGFHFAVGFRGDEKTKTRLPLLRSAHNSNQTRGDKYPLHALALHVYK